RALGAADRDAAGAVRRQYVRRRRRPLRRRASGSGQSMTSPTPNRRALFTIACLGMLAFGIVLTTLSSVLPSVIERFGIDKAVAGSLFLLMTFGILVGSVVFGPIVDRNGHKGLLFLA